MLIFVEKNVIMVPILKRRCRKEGTIESYRWMLFQKESAGYDKTDKHIGKKIRRLKGDKKVRSKRYKKTYEFKDEKYSPELIRKYEDPEYAKAAEKYERQARRKQTGRSKKRHAASEVTAPTGKGKRSARSTKKKKYRLNKKKLFRNILALVLLLAVFGSGFFFYLTRNFDKVDTSNADFAIDDQVADDLSGYRNIAILGSDARADEGYDGSRTDAIIIMSIKKSSGDIRLISVMRDSYLKMEYFDGNMVLDKVTHAHHYAGGMNTIASLNRSLDLNIKEFVIFNWKAVADAVDCLGGIKVDVKANEINDMNKWGNETAVNVGGTYNQITETGKQTLDGVQATTYCRIRKTSGGDEGRSRRYKKIMAAVMKKAMLQPWKLNELSETVFPNIRTNMSQFKMYTAAINAPRYSFGKSISWPKAYWAGYLGEISYVVPQTLESNVQRLHRLAFGQKNYSVSATCRQISQEIIDDTGVY